MWVDGKQVGNYNGPTLEYVVRGEDGYPTNGCDQGYWDDGDYRPAGISVPSDVFHAGTMIGPTGRVDWRESAVRLWARPTRRLDGSADHVWLCSSTWAQYGSVACCSIAGSRRRPFLSPQQDVVIAQR